MTEQMETPKTFKEGRKTEKSCEDVGEYGGVIIIYLNEGATRIRGSVWMTNLFSSLFVHRENNVIGMTTNFRFGIVIEVVGTIGVEVTGALVGGNIVL